MHSAEVTPRQDQTWVWDPFVRIFHWSLVVAFAVAYLVEEPLTTHVWAGYVVGILVVTRVVWGFFGAGHARFSDFAYSPAEVVSYLRDMIGSRAKRYLGHSPGGAAMVFTLLVCLAATVVTGLIVYGGEHQAGPLAGIFSKETSEAVEEAHALCANITLALVFFHLVGVALASFSHHENLVRAMIIGFKRP
jgi:cytochrome b